VKPIDLGLIDNASAYLQTPVPTYDKVLKRSQTTNRVSNLHTAQAAESARFKFPLPGHGIEVLLGIDYVRKTKQKKFTPNITENKPTVLKYVKITRK
jgi:hypothetical protein